MSAAPERRRRPLVYATLEVQRAAERIMPGRVVENEIERAIMASRVSERRDTAHVFGDGWRAYIVRQPARRRSGARSWLATDLQPTAAQSAGAGTDGGPPRHHSRPEEER